MEEWIEKQKSLLGLESIAEKEQLAEKIQSLSAKECEKQGLSLLHLQLVGTKTSLFGRFSITLESNRVKNKVLDQVSFKAGDEVVLYSSRKSRSSQQTNTNTKANGIDNNKDENIITGVVSKVNHAIIEIVTEQTPEDVSLESPLRMDLRSNDYTHKKMVDILDELSKSSHGLIPLLFGQLQLNSYSMRNLNIEATRGGEFCTLNTKLNSSQRSAIQGALQSTYIALIHGPPGTGKTSTVTELIFQAVARQQRVLVCAPSNIAVDSVLEKIVAQLDTIAMNSATTGSGAKHEISRRMEAASIGDMKISSTYSNSNCNNSQYDIQDDLLVSSSTQTPVHTLPRVLRLGHPARISESIMQHCLDSQILSDEGTEVVDDIKKEISTLRQSLVRQDANSKKAYSGSSINYREVRSELRSLQKDLRVRETRIVKSIVSSKNVILCTNVGAGNRLLRDIEFDLVIIDECAQGLEASCWIPMLRGRKCVLAGDHLQLPPTIKSKEAESGGLSTTLFERLMRNTSQFGSVSFLLDTQYRMNASICDWASKEMYKGQLKSHESVSGHSLQDFKLQLPEIDLSVAVSISTESVVVEPDSAKEMVSIDVPVMLLLDTADCDMNEDHTEEGTSHSNAHEVSLVYRHVCMLLRAGLRPTDIGVITPYNAQVQLLKKKFFSSGADDDEDDEDGEGAVNKKNTSSRDINLDGTIFNFDGLEIRSVDGFQGGERECIILSLVRSNQSREVGFLSDHRRINVAVTRAKRHLCVICDSQTCSQDVFIGTLLRHITEGGEYRCVQELQFASDVELWARSGRTVVDQKQQQLQFEKASGQYTAKVSDDPSILIEEIVNGYVLGQFAKKLRSCKLQYFTFTQGQPSEKLEVVSYDRLGTMFKQGVPLLLRFPVQCSSLERKLLHQACEARGLFHRSVGIEPRRYTEICNLQLPSPLLSATATTATTPTTATTAIIAPSTATATATATTTAVSSLTATASVNTAPSPAILPMPTIPKSALTASPAGAIGPPASTAPINDSDDESEASETERDLHLKPTATQSYSTQKKSSENKKKNNKKSGGSTHIITKPVKYYVSEERQKAIDAAQAKMRNLDPFAFDDEMVAIEAAISANLDYANLTKYRVGATAMPNPDKIKTTNSLRTAIEEAENSRKGKTAKDNETTGASRPVGGQHKKKVLKKPSAVDMKKLSGGSNT